MIDGVYDWKVIHNYYTEISEKYGPELMKDEAFTSFYMQNISSVLKITSTIAKSPMWEGMAHVKTSIRLNLVDMISALFWGLAVPIRTKTQIEPNLDAFKHAVDTYSNMPEMQIHEEMLEIMRFIVSNVNDVLSELQDIMNKSQDLHYLDITRIMYLTGLFIGNSFVYAGTIPDGKLRPDNNIFANYITLLTEIYESIEKK